ncbi:nucleotide-binding protein [Pediococcus ethanolidurans]|uniref:AAA family ATPase n=1 Tax=Pediococcus ethanolidurans TaxID=319653 RepID=UPI0021A9CA45|nr:AAA family ATPase [Pediococcus ethanolidurans]MCT4397665.1 nucleotide-binding protein [Pediococcus ethanolidurans]
MKFYASGKLPKVPSMYFIYGDGGTGKTSLFKKFPGKKMLMTFDRSTNVIESKDNIDTFIFEPDDMANIQSLVVGYLQRAIASGKYQAIALDNVSALQNFVLENIDDASKDGRQNYQKLQLWFRQLSDMLRSSGTTIYATAHQINADTTSLDGTGGYQPDMNEKTFNAFASMFDLVGRIYMHDGERMIDLNPENGNHAKNRLDNRTLIKAEDLLKTEKESD